MLSVLFLLPAVAISQQSLVDSLRQQWVQGEVNTEQLEQLLELAKATSDTDLEGGLALAEYGVSLSEGLGEKAWVVKFLSEKGIVLQLQSKFEAALRAH